MSALNLTIPNTTQNLIACGVAAFHLRPEVRDLTHDPSDKYANPWISSRSRWRDDTWRMDNPTPGLNPGVSTINWRRPLSDGSSLIDPQRAELLHAFRCLAWSLVVDPRKTSALGPGSMSTLSRGIHVLAWWMQKNNYTHFGELNSTASAEFVSDLRRLVDEVKIPTGVETEVDFSEAEEHIESIARDENEEDLIDDLVELGLAQVVPPLNIWVYIWNQTAALVEAGIPSMPEPPFNGVRAYAMARKIADREIGQIPWLPDEVAAPILNVSFRLIGQPADDVIDLHLAYLKARNQFSASHPYGSKATRRVLEAFTFTTLIGETAPWHEPLRDTRGETRDGIAIDISPADQLVRLISMIRDAAVIVIQSSGGQRINEICSLEAGIGPETGLPACITVRPSFSGLSDLFYLRGLLSKTRPTPVMAEWLIGCRPRGSDWIPPPVRAIDILQRLYEPWRALAAPAVAKGLLVECRGRIPNTGSAVRRCSSVSLRRRQKYFVSQFVDLSGLPDSNARGEDLARYRDSRGLCVVTHQWRKSYARYMFRIDNSLLHAVSRQFKHLSVAMTESDYIGNDPTMLRDLDTALVDHSLDFFEQFTGGRSGRVAGKMGAIIAHHRTEIEKAMIGDTREERRESLRTYILKHDLRIFFNSDGNCLMRLRPTEARCHELAGTADWKNSIPNYQARDTNTCLGCKCFAIDGTHDNYWTDRFRQNQAAWLAAKASGLTTGFRVVKKRADQARAVLRVLDIPIPTVTMSDAS